MGTTIPPAGAAARATARRLREWRQLRALFWTALFSGGIRTSIVCQKDALIIAVTSVFFVSFFSLGHWNGVSRSLRTSNVEAMWLPVSTPYPPPPPPPRASLPLRGGGRVPRFWGCVL